MQEKSSEKMCQVFASARYGVDPNLNGKIWAAIVARNKHLARIKLWIFSSTLVASVLGLIPVISVLSKNLARSGFPQYLSLVFSDIGSITSFWREFGLLLAESLPLMSIILTLLLTFIFFLSLRYAMKQVIIRDQLSF